jgi:hypothetical protein
VNAVTAHLALDDYVEFTRKPKLDISSTFLPTTFNVDVEAIEAARRPSVRNANAPQECREHVALAAEQVRERFGQRDFVVTE